MIEIHESAQAKTTGEIQYITGKQDGVTVYVTRTNPPRYYYSIKDISKDHGCARRKYKPSKLKALGLGNRESVGTQSQWRNRT